MYADPTGLKLQPINLPGLGDTYLDSSIIPAVKQWIDSASKSCCVKLSFTSAFRSTQKQKDIADDKNSITPAKPGTSLHEAGYAVDISWISIPENRKKCVVKNSGLSWGGNLNPPDEVHFFREVPGGRKNRTKYINEAQDEYKKLTQDNSGAK